MPPPSSAADWSNKRGVREREMEQRIKRGVRERDGAAYQDVVGIFAWSNRWLDDTLLKQNRDTLLWRCM